LALLMSGSLTKRNESAVVALASVSLIRVSVSIRG